jgi:glyceraldehyde-3-phosphate dehydrogenase type II
VTHGHIISIVATPKKTISKETLIDAFREHPRIRVVRIAEGFNSNTSLFKYARDLGNKRGDMYEIGVWEECFGTSGDDMLFAINIPQEAVTIPETVDGIRAADGDADRPPGGGGADQPVPGHEGGPLSGIGLPWYPVPDTGGMPWKPGF